MNGHPTKTRETEVEIMEQIAYIREWSARFTVPIPEARVYARLYARVYE
jgi:hypothetical protein